MVMMTMMIDDVVECGDNDDDQALKSIPDGSSHQVEEERDTDYSGKKRWFDNLTMPSFELYTPFIMVIILNPWGPLVMPVLHIVLAQHTLNDNNDNEFDDPTS